MPRYTSKYSEKENSAIRFNIIGALQALGRTQGVSIKAMQTTYPYSVELNRIPSQKISAELKKLVDTGMVVRSTKSLRNSGPMKYMLRSIYEDLGFSDDNSYGYNDYRDELTEEEEEAICERLELASHRTRYEDMW